MKSEQFLELKARQRENDIAMLALAKKQEANKKCEMVRVDKRTIIMQPIGDGKRKTKIPTPSVLKSTEVKIIPTRLITDLTPDELRELVREYPNEANRDLAVKYGVSISQLQQYACRNKIHKSDDFRSNRARQHALIGRRQTTQKYGKR